jgi:thiosulfate/3-mercaptopyruvate sulfurtransferase
MAEYAHPESLVSTEWVAAHGSDANVRLVEVDVDTSAYDQGHITGAVGWNWENQLQENVSRDLVSKSDMEALLGGAGISNDTTVILYGDNNNWFAAWAFWQMKYYGHGEVKLMNGGRAKWEAEGRALTTDAASHSSTSYSASEPNEDIRAYRDYVLGAVGKGNIHLVDVRAPAEFSGELLAPAALPQEGAQRGGHIPGASNVPWATAVAEDGSFKTADELHAVYGGVGVDGSRETIAYCRIGERSSHTWFVLTQLLGYDNVRNYDGSWTEWGSIVKAPIEK